MSARDGIKDKSVKESDLIVLLNHICGTGLATSNKRHDASQDLRQDHLKATHLSLLLPLSPTHHTHGPSTQRYTATPAMLPAYPPSHSYRSSVVALARKHMSPERSWWHCSDMRPPALVSLERRKHFFSCMEYTVNFGVQNQF